MWLRSPSLCDVVAAADSTRPRAMPLAMLTMKKKRLGFIISYVSPISTGMGLRSPALRAGEAAPL